MAREALNLSCPQCGGPVDVPEGASYARCSYCSAESFIDLTGAILTQVIKVTIGRARVPGLLRARAREGGWTDAHVTDLSLTYEPVWELEGADGQRTRIGARPGPQGRFERVELPGGERGFVEPGEREGADSWIEPELAPESAAEVAARVTGRPVSVKVIRLAHRPIYAGRVEVAGEAKEFRVDAVSGDVLGVDWPREAGFSRRNQAWLATAAMVLAAALLPSPAAIAAVLAVGAGAAWSLSRATESSARV